MIRQVSFENRWLLSGLVVGVVLIGGLAGCAPTAEDLRIEGVQYFRNQQTIESMATFRHALDLAPSDPQSNYYMGLNYRTIAAKKFRESDYTAAYRELDTSIIYFTQAIKTWPNYMEAIAAKNEALEARGKYGEALAVAADVTHTTRGYAADHFIYLGNEYRERADYDNALRAYKIALSNEPTSAKAFAAMGNLYERVGNLELAKDSYRRAHELNQAESGVTAALGRLEVGSGIHSASHESNP